MRIAIDFDCLLHNGDLHSGIINYELYEELKQLKDEHDLTLRVNLSNFSFSDLNAYLDVHQMECWFQGIEVVTDASQYLVSDRAITCEQFLLITKNYVPDTDLFQEAVSWNQSQTTIYGETI